MEQEFNEGASETCCVDCAFRPGTDAYTYAPTILKVKLCIESGNTFYCHKKVDATGNPLICRGFKKIMSNRQISKEGTSISDDERNISAYLLDIITSQA